MTMHTFSDNVLVKSSFCGVPAASTQNGTGVDTLGYRRAAVIVNIAAGVGTTVNYQLQDSPDNTTWTNVAGATLGSPVAASTNAVELLNVDLAKRQRYLRVQVIGTGTAGAVSATVQLFQGQNLAPTQDNTPISV